MQLFSHAGLVAGFPECMRCAQQHGQKVNSDKWTDCQKDCILCNTRGHKGEPCSLMRTTYADVFTPSWLELHCGMKTLPALRVRGSMRGRPARVAERTYNPSIQGNERHARSREREGYSRSRYARSRSPSRVPPPPSSYRDRSPLRDRQEYRDAYPPPWPSTASGRPSYGAPQPLRYEEYRYDNPGHGFYRLGYGDSRHSGYYPRPDPFYAWDQRLEEPRRDTPYSYAPRLEEPRRDVSYPSGFGGYLPPPGTGAFTPPPPSAPGGIVSQSHPRAEGDNRSTKSEKPDATPSAPPAPPAPHSKLRQIVWGRHKAKRKSQKENRKENQQENLEGEVDRLQGLVDEEMDRSDKLETELDRVTGECSGLRQGAAQAQDKINTLIAAGQDLEGRFKGTQRLVTRYRQMLITAGLLSEEGLQPPGGTAAGTSGGGTEGQETGKQVDAD